MFFANGIRKLLDLSNKYVEKTGDHFNSQSANNPSNLTRKYIFVKFFVMGLNKFVVKYISGALSPGLKWPCQ